MDEDSNRNSRPVPDPTSLTTEQLHREIAALREFVLGEIHHVREVSQVKFVNVDKGVQGVAERTLEQKQDTKAALDAALQAAKDAVTLQTAASDKAIAKSEAATTKQIDALAVQLSKTVEALDDKIGDVKDRVSKLETAKTTQTDSSGKLWGQLAVVVSVLALLVLVYGQLK